MYNLIFGPALFYDIPEYLSIVANHSFWQSLSLGHFPIHPIFLGIIWILIKFIPVNAIAMFFGVISIFIFYKISKLVFKDVCHWLSVIIFAIFPAVWLINTNLMVESVTLTFYLAALYFFLLQKRIRFVVFLFLLIGTHLEAIVWVPTIFLIPFVLDFKIKKAILLKYIKFSLLAVALSIIFYTVLYYLSGQAIGGTTEQLSAYFSSGVLRMVRNTWLSFATDFGSLTPFVLIFLLVRNIKSKKVWIPLLTFFGIVGLIAANWQGDFMGRRIVFAAVILALLLYKYLREKSLIMVLYLIPIVLANIILYSNGSPFAAPNIPSGQVLIETHYLKPFTKYDGTTLWIGIDDLEKIDSYLKAGKRVFLTRQAVTAPYLLLVGNNYHITSLGKIGDSESRFLFSEYAVEPYGNSLELKLYKGEASKEAGQPIIFYDDAFWARLARRRIDYGDIGSWIWALATNHRDPTGWTYKDVRGIWYNM